MSEDTDRNLWMAEKLGKKSVQRSCSHCKITDGPVNPLDKACDRCGQEADIVPMFNLSTNAADREAALIWLMKQGVDLHWYDPEDAFEIFCERAVINTAFYSTHKEALFAAIDYVRKDKG